ncbi:MAG TPA: hypothetical protein VF510_18250 [Ktedonobacterales bacterium]
MMTSTHLITWALRFARADAFDGPQWRLLRATVLREDVSRYDSVVLRTHPAPVAEGERSGALESILP